MDKTIIEALGLTREEITSRVIDKIAGEVMTDVGIDDDGEEHRLRSTVARKINEKVREAVDTAVSRIGAEILTPKVEEMVRGIVLQKTNQWGDKVGQPVTFTEYLTQRADEFLREEVNHNGQSKAEARNDYTWCGSTTRVVWMIDKYLKYEIETFAKKALANANATIAEGISDAVKSTMKKLADGVVVTAVGEK